MCIDEGGTDYIWQRLFEDYHFGFIHLAVQLHIVLSNPGIGMERYVYNNEDKQCGRADIFNLETGEVWELKTVRTGAAAADLQVTQYCGNHLKNSKKPITKGSAGMFPGRFAGTFELSCMGDNYTVIYYTPEPGVILYAVKRSSIKATGPYAVYVPTPQTTPEKQSTIGGIPAYGTNSGTGYAAAGLAMFGAVGYLFIGGGYGNNRSYCFQ